MNTLKRLILLSGVIFFSFVPDQLKAQRLEFGILAGTTNYSGELSDFQVNPVFFKPAFGLLTRYNLSPRIALKGAVIYGEIMGADSMSSSAKSKARNLSFRSDIFEFSAQVQFNLIRYDQLARNGRYKKFIPCLFGGLAVYKYNPKAKYAGTWWELQTLGTEGQGTTQFQQRKKYALTQISIPLGVEFKFELSKRINFAVEAGVRITFNDYLDDVSKTYIDTSFLRAAYGPISAALADRSPEVSGVKIGTAGSPRGNSSNKDFYYFAGISITYKIQNAGQKCPKFN